LREDIQRKATGQAQVRLHILCLALTTDSVRLSMATGNNRKVVNKVVALAGQTSGFLRHLDAICKPRAGHGMHGKITVGRKSLSKLR
jgi:hypothetical protein